MGLFPRNAEVATGVDLALLGILAAIIGGYIENVSSVPYDSFTGAEELTLVRAAGVIPEAIGSAIFLVGITVAVGGPLACWVGWPLYLRLR